MIKTAKKQGVDRSVRVVELLNAAAGYHQRGWFDMAEGLYREALALDARNPDCLHSLGILCHQTGRHDEAASMIGKAIERSGGKSPAYFHHLGAVYSALGQHERAIATLKQGLTLDPKSAEAHNNLGIAYYSSGRVTEAADHFERALSLSPDYPDALFNLGNLLLDAGRSKEAEAHFERLSRLRPENPEVLHGLARALANQGQFQKSADLLRQALEKTPADVAIMNFLGIVNMGMGHLAEAGAILEKALATKPGFPEATLNLGRVLLDSHRYEEAREHFLGAYRGDPSRTDYLLKALLTLPRLNIDRTTIIDVRKRLGEAFEQVSSLPPLAGDPVKELDECFFYLAYQGENDRPLMESACRTFRQLYPALNLARTECSFAAQPDAAPKIRIGILSRLLREHTVAKLTQGYFRQLDRQRFHVTVIHAYGVAEDETRRAIDSVADEVVTLPADLAAAQQQVAGLGLDMLYFPDIGMSTYTYFLAYARMAPVQAVSWGHPVTTGLDSIDYFLSLDAAELPGAETHYSETLIRFTRPPAYYEPVVVSGESPERRDFGLPLSGRLYGCPQSLFKFHPDFDGVLAGIVERDPEGWVVVIEGKDPSWRDFLLARWRLAHHAALPERVIFLPRQSHTRFLSLLSLMDVLLDTVHFGSGNTFYESLALGIPTVTWPGEFMRGRLVSAMYRLLDVADAPVVGKLEEYAPLAVALASDMDRRQRLHGELMEKSAGLFMDSMAVREFESFAIAAVQAAKRGEKLPAGWKPTPANVNSKGVL